MRSVNTRIRFVNEWIRFVNTGIKSVNTGIRLVNAGNRIRSEHYSGIPVIISPVERMYFNIFIFKTE